eukprot:scaffold3388_cov105-Isochrysis_galbana.AAC.5
MRALAHSRTYAPTTTWTLEGSKNKTTSGKIRTSGARNAPGLRCRPIGPSAADRVRSARRADPRRLRPLPQHRPLCHHVGAALHHCIGVCLPGAAPATCVPHCSAAWRSPRTSGPMHLAGLHSLRGATMAGRDLPYQELAGKPVLMVNVASR